MKTALFITDCSVDAALFLNGWASNQSIEPTCLTVVHPYDLDPGQTLNKENCREARQQARARLAQWLILLQMGNAVGCRTEILLATPDLATTIHLVLRPYDYVFADGQYTAVAPASADSFHQADTQLHYLSSSADLLQAA